MENFARHPHFKKFSQFFLILDFENSSYKYSHSLLIKNRMDCHHFQLYLIKLFNLSFIYFLKSQVFFNYLLLYFSDCPFLNWIFFFCYNWISLCCFGLSKCLIIKIHLLFQYIQNFVLCFFTDFNICNIIHFPHFRRLQILQNFNSLLWKL
jgi:hypothetical protein